MLLKQKVTFKFQNLDYKEALSLMAKIGDVNIRDVVEKIHEADIEVMAYYIFGLPKDS